MAVTKSKAVKAKPSGVGKSAVQNRTAPDGPVSTIKEGDRVRVLSGPFGNALGVVQRVSGAAITLRVNPTCEITEDDSNLEVRP